MSLTNEFKIWNKGAPFLVATRVALFDANFGFWTEGAPFLRQSRALPAVVPPSVNTTQGTEPLIILKVEWGGTIGTRYYSERFLQFGSITALSRILKIGNLASVARQNHVGMMTTISFKMDDSGGDFKAVYDTINVERIKATVYQHFDGNSEADLVELFSGVVTGPIVWYEGERTLELTLETNYLEREVGYAPDFSNAAAGLGGTFLSKGDGTDETCVGKPWPICFGTVQKMPAVRIKKAPHAQIVRQDGLTFLLDDVGRCPLGFAQVIVDGIIFEGTFGTNSFTVSIANLPKFQNVAVGSRGSGDPDIANPSVIWMSSYRPVVGQCLHFNFGNILTVDPNGNPYTTQFLEVFRVVKQQGRKLWLDRPIYNAAGVPIALASGFIVYVSKEPQVGWPSPFDTQGNRNFQVVRNNGTVTGYRFSYGAGAALRVVGYPDVYVTSLNSATPYAIFAQRRGRLELVPSQFFTYGQVSLYGKSAFGVTFPFPLDFFEDQGWDGDQIWITQSAGDFTPAAAIQYILQNYTGLTVDATSFSLAGQSAIGACNFALTSIQNAIQVCDQIAYQAGLGISIVGNLVKLSRFAYEPTSVMTITESKIEAYSMKLMLTDPGRIYTKLTAKWNEDYSKQARELTRIQNAILYGTVSEDTEFYIFNRYGHVYQSAFFWLNRFSNIWKVVSFKMDMPGIILKIFDGVTLQFSDTTLLGVAAVKGVVIGAEYDVKTKSVEVTCLLPFKAGTTTIDPYFWLDSQSFSQGVPPDFTFLVGADAEDLAEAQDSDKIDEVHASAPAVVTKDGGTAPPGFDFVVDVYGDGFYDINGNPNDPTMFAVPTRASGPMLPSVGDQISVSFSNKQAYATPIPQKTFIFAKLLAEPQSGIYSFQEYDPVAFAFVQNGIIGTCIELNGSTGIMTEASGTGTVVILFPATAGEWRFFFPVATCT